MPGVIENVYDNDGDAVYDVKVSSETELSDGSLVAAGLMLKRINNVDVRPDFSQVPNFDDSFDSRLEDEGDSDAGSAAYGGRYDRDGYEDEHNDPYYERGRPTSGGDGDNSDDLGSNDLDDTRRRQGDDDRSWSSPSQRSMHASTDNSSPRQRIKLDLFTHKATDNNKQKQNNNKRTL